ncbi:sugar ABC transporter substrate-binding protein [Atopobacter sp. AH10]|uniref:ABC transporter substrate-binding protein n=1 Tax=Atopobacter sp. AH10 TaxID=2315861 RepID=UPI000EF1B00C|nr:sugar ABC transporter substrate-binding protein [Atopobacter sp. AH10]RLK63374.1 sugar ABC transporter substrate-binding protein [Atopobacter sp. AH10]
MKRKIFSIVLSVVAVLALFLSGAKANVNAAEKSAKKTTIQLLVPGYEEGYLKEQLDSRIALFEKKNPTIKVKIVSAGWDELNEKIVQLYQAKQAPDLMLVGSRSLRQFGELGALEDLSTYMTKEKKDSYIKNVLATGQVDKKQFGLPMALSSRCLFYRKDLIKEAPKTWEDLKKVAQEQTTDKQKGFAIPTDVTSGTDEILNFIYQGGGQIVDKKGDFVINSKENIATLTYLVSLKKFIPDPVSTSRRDQSKQFVNADLAMFISGGWEKETMDKNQDKTPYATAFLPEGKKKGVTIVTDSYAMSSLSKHKKEAYKFLDFMSQLDNQKVVTAAYGWFPILKEESKDKKYSSDFNKPMYDIIQYGTPEPQVPNWDEFNKSFITAVQKALTGEASPKEALDNCQKELTK